MRKTFLRFLKLGLLSLLYLGIIANHPFPQSDRYLRNISSFTWFRTGGPSGGLGYDVRIHPINQNIMFVTDNPSGVNKSYDGGATWVQKNQGITTRTSPASDGIPIFSLTIDPNNPDIIWAGTQDSKGIYRSKDGGETWVKKDKGIVEGNEISFRGFAVRPGNSNVVFAGAEIATGIQGVEFDRTKGKIYMTRNGGKKWRCVWEGDNLARIILIDPENPNKMYASTGIFDREAFNEEGVGVLKSVNGGKTWFKINNGIPNFHGNLFVGFLEMHPNNPQILFAASGNNAMGQGGIFRTVDAGQSWTKVLAEDIFTVVTLSPTNPDIIYAGSEHAFYRSDDFGESWKKYQKQEEGSWGPPGVRAGFPISAVVHPSDPFTVFANNYGGGFFVSTDGGESWENRSKGYTGAHLHDIAMDTDNSATVYTIGRSGPFMSKNSGSEWNGLAYGAALYPEWYAVAVNPFDAHEVIISSEHEGALLKSMDSGISWNEVFNHPLAEGDPAKRHGFKAITYAPSSPDIIYAGMCKGRRTTLGDFPPGPSFGMFKSTDGGESWQEINVGLRTSFMNVNCIAVHPRNPDIVYIGTWRDGVFRTDDGGGSWVEKNNGLESSDICSLAIDPKNPRVIYAGLGEGAGIFKSKNGGKLWKRANNGLNIQCPSYLMPFGKVAPGISLVKKPLRISGANYSIPWTAIWDIVIDPTNSKIVYAADHQSGVYISTDKGSSWTSFNKGLSTKAVTP